LERRGSKSFERKKKEKKIVRRIEGSKSLERKKKSEKNRGI
jgi:hypothetical protein